MKQKRTWGVPLLALANEAGDRAGAADADKGAGCAADGEALEDGAHAVGWWPGDGGAGGVGGGLGVGGAVGPAGGVGLEADPEGQGAVDVGGLGGLQARKKRRGGSGAVRKHEARGAWCVGVGAHHGCCFAKQPRWM